MSINNLNSYMIDRPTWEQLAFAPVTGIAGTCNCDDNRRFIYTYFQTSTTAAQFWRYDTWADCWQQLATPATQTGSVGFIRYVSSVGGQWSGNTYGSVWLFIGNGTTCYWYKFDIATNTWSTMSTTNIPAAFGTDVGFTYPEPQLNGNDGSYHSGITKTITTSASVAVGATSISVSALPIALASGTRLRFGSFNVTLSAVANQGSSTLSVVALPQGIAAGTLIETPDGDYITVKTTAVAGATSLVVYPIRKALLNATVLTLEQYVVLTAAAAASATSITVAPVMYTISSGAYAYYYDHMYLIGNNATVMYRYSVSTNAWALTNASGTTIPAITGTCGAGCTIKWLPSFNTDNLYIIRGGGTANIYVYSLSGNTFSTLTFYPSTETFTTGSAYSVRSVNDKGFTLLIQKDATMRVYELDIGLNRMLPKTYQWLYPTSTAVQGDRSACMRSPDNIEFYYLLLHSSNAFVRTALLDS